MTLRPVALGALLAALALGPARADPRVAAGERAYNRGAYVEAAQEFFAPAKEGDAKAETYLGYMHQRGLGVTKNYAQAADWLHEAAIRGEPLAQFLLAGLYDKGLGVPHDFVQAYVWFDLAAARAEPRQRDHWMNMRDAVATKLSYDELALAQAKALAFIPLP